MPHTIALVCGAESIAWEAQGPLIKSPAEDLSQDTQQEESPAKREDS
jgi:hypothetical protein